MPYFAAIASSDDVTLKISQGQVLGLVEVPERFIEDGAHDGYLYSMSAPYSLALFEWVEIDHPKTVTVEPLVLPTTEELEEKTP